jgi:3-hydroxyisobutyrate dehydrogenase
MQERIGFIGLGVMGVSMAGHLLRAGYSLVVNNRTRSKAEPLLAAGAEWAPTPADVAARTQITITMLGYPSDVKEVYLGPSGLVNAAAPGSLLIDMTTSDPELAKELAIEGLSKKVRILDAPVSGGDIGARNATLSIMVGGERSAFDDAQRYFQLLGKQITYLGSAGSGQLCKLSNQVAIASTMVSVCESMTFAARTGLDPQIVLQSISAGAASSWSLTQLMPRILGGDAAPGFMIKHFVKDLGLALQCARRLDLSLPGLTLAEQLYRRLLEAGHGEKGTQALLWNYLPERAR